MKQFLSETLRSTSITALSVAAISILLALFSNYLPKEKTLSLFDAAILSSVIILLSSILFDFIVHKYKEKDFTSPKIIKYIEKSNLIITEPTKWLGIGTYVSFYYTGNGYEEALAIGYVQNIQTDKKIQINIEQTTISDPSIFGRLSEGNIPDRENIILKPGANKYIIERAQ